MSQTLSLARNVEADLEQCIFCKVVRRTVAARIVHEDSQVLAFEDINPQAPVHVLVIPKKHIVSLNDLDEQDVAIAGSLFQAARRVAELKKIHLTGYRTVINTNSNAGQTVSHLHLHVLGGRRMNWPPG